MKQLILCAALALVACGAPKTETPKPPETAAAITKGPNAASLVATTISAAEDDQQASSVYALVRLERADARLYSTVGGDPAINGEYVFLAIHGDPAEGVKIYKVGDFNAWELVSQTPTSAVLKVGHSAIDEATGDVVNAEQKIRISVPSFDANEISLEPVD